MERYDFDKIVDRRGTSSYKWDSTENKDLIPMWVADMDFRTADCIIDALEQRVRHGVFGYTRVPEKYYEAIIGWFKNRHGWDIDRNRIIYTTGVIPALSATIKALTSPGDKVIVQTPVYNHFFSSINNNGCEVVENRLITEQGRYVMDYDDLERKAQDPKVKLMLLCNPHNPTGRVWTTEELAKLNEICLRNNVIVVSDEIHCELVFPGNTFIPFASISRECRDNCITCNSPTKAFNIAGLQIANIIVPSKEVGDKIDRAININEVCDVNPFGVIALIAAYTDGEEWLEALIDYLYQNYLTLKEYFELNLPQLPISTLEGTYLVWVDCRSLPVDVDTLEKGLLEEEHLWLNSGTMYRGEGFLRINIACPRSVMLEGLDRFKKYINKHF